jgi:hypothetical protein
MAAHENVTKWPAPHSNDPIEPMTLANMRKGMLLLIRLPALAAARTLRALR